MTHSIRRPHTKLYSVPSHCVVSSLIFATTVHPTLAPTLHSPWSFLIYGCLLPLPRFPCLWIKGCMSSTLRLLLASTRPKSSFPSRYPLKHSHYTRDLDFVL
eukprot:jgi/Psemu1/62309/gm1.62309_g